jgi:hypothetical protein
MARFDVVDGIPSNATPGGPELRNHSPGGATQHAQPLDTPRHPAEAIDHKAIWGMWHIGLFVQRALNPHGLQFRPALFGAVSFQAIECKADCQEI